MPLTSIEGRSRAPCAGGDELVNRPILAIVATLASAIASAETTQCNLITSVPVTLGTPGNYCLRNDLQMPPGANVPAITITADNVTVDLNAHRITGPGLGVNQVGVSSIAHGGITVRNGALSNFIQAVVIVGNTSTALVEDLEVNTTVTAISVDGVSVIRRNRVNNSSANGIYIPGNANGMVIISDNVVTNIGTSTSSPAAGIGASYQTIIVERNVVANVVGATGSAAIVLGSGGSAVDNRQLNAPVGVLCTLGGLIERVRDNVTVNVPAATNGCNLLGTNG
jgi:hypothetical protein